MSSKISIIDYGMGNIKSVRNAFRFLGTKTEVVHKAEELSIDKKILIPGVGAFGDAMENLRNYVPKIKDAIENGVPILGICLGMQVFFEKSQEFKGSKGLGVLSGNVIKIDTDLNLPQIGWNSLEIKKNRGPLFEDIDGGYVYYANSYHCEPQEEIIVATSEYGVEVTASVWKGNVYGTQFHPEKSGKLGLKILKNFEGL